MLSIENLLEQSRKNYPIIEKNWGIKLDFTPKSLRDIEIVVAMRNINNPQMEMMIVLGMYLGEMIMKNLDAEWLEIDENENNLGNIGINIKENGGNTNIFPFIRVKRFFEESDQELYSWYNFLVASLNGEFEDNLDRKWFETGKGYSVRSRTVTEEMMEEDEEVKYKINTLNKGK